MKMRELEEFIKALVGAITDTKGQPDTTPRQLPAASARSATGRAAAEELTPEQWATLTFNSAHWYAVRDLQNKLSPGEEKKDFFAHLADKAEARMRAAGSKEDATLVDWLRNLSQAMQQSRSPITSAGTASVSATCIEDNDLTDEEAMICNSVLASGISHALHIVGMFIDKNRWANRLREQLADEKRRRVYYQDIVYQVCNHLDRCFGGTTVSGTVNSPSTEVQDRVGELHRRITGAEAATIAKVVKWLRKKADLAYAKASANQNGSSPIAQRWYVRQSEAMWLADVLESGELAKEQQPQPTTTTST